MAEDIDDLLDEVESKFCRSSASGPSKGVKKNAQNARAKGGPSLTRKDESDLNSVIDDICADDGPLYKPHSTQQSQRDASSHGSSSRRKCFPVYLGGSQYATGLSSSSVKRTCDKLRCTSCDFQVVSFNDYQWHSRSDYLFFRNNIPDFNKLKVNLLQKTGCKAYACQCCWRSTTKLIDIETDPELRWVCGKH